MKMSSLPDHKWNRRGSLSRADLLFALELADNNAEREAALVSILGYEKKPESEIETDTSSKNTLYFAPMTMTASGKVELTTTPKRLQFAPYYLTTVKPNEQPELQPVQAVEDQQGLQADDYLAWEPNSPVPAYQPLLPWNRLWPKLRQSLSQQQQRGLDIPRLLHLLTEQRLPKKLPLKPVRCWPAQLLVVLDFSDRLTPYWNDWHWLHSQLQSRLRSHCQTYAMRSIRDRQLYAQDDTGSFTQPCDWPQLHQGDVLLLVSDLGMLDAAHPMPAQVWQQQLAYFKRQGIEVIVLAPVAERHLQAPLVNRSSVLRLSGDSQLRKEQRLSRQHDKPDETESVQARETILTMMSIATLVEPGLLRAMRQGLPEATGDSSLEAEVWCHQHLDTATSGCALSPYAIEQWRQRFAALSDDLQDYTLECLRNWHAPRAKAVHHEEVLIWHHLVNTHLQASQQEYVDKARSFFLRLSHSLSSNSDGAGEHNRTFLTRLVEHHVNWIAPTLGQRQANQSYLLELESAIAQARPKQAQEALSSGIDGVTWLTALETRQEQQVNLVVHADQQLSIQPFTTPAQPLQPATTLLANFRLDREALLWTDATSSPERFHKYWWQKEQQTSQQLSTPAPIIDREQPADNPQHVGLMIMTRHLSLQFEPFHAPPWASDFGQDGYGLYADLNINGVVQRMRWIAPGEFLMGSPITEPERFGRETQYRVVLTTGFWLADTTCTQRLWLELMSDNPAYFSENLNQPVERISWGDCKKFIDILNKTVSGIDARFPTEAEWEYACRAGTSTPFSFGETINPDQVNYDGNFPYNNSPKGEFRQKTVTVKSFPANPWGLYEMHGNVWEWCVDCFGDFDKEIVDFDKRPVINPVGPKFGIRRIVRGGSWNHDAGRGRSASRYWRFPIQSMDSVGFRFALTS